MEHYLVSWCHDDGSRAWVVLPLTQGLDPVKELVSRGILEAGAGTIEIFWSAREQRMIRQWARTGETGLLDAMTGYRDGLAARI